MVASYTAVAALAGIFISQANAAAVPQVSSALDARGGGIPASNPPGVTCYNTWETVTNDVCEMIRSGCKSTPVANIQLY
jgi:hypothetical protein